MYNKFERELLNEGAKLKTWDAPNNSGSNGLSAKINFCPMCGKRVEQQ